MHVHTVRRLKSFSALATATLCEAATFSYLRPVHTFIDCRLNHFVSALDYELFALGRSCPSTCDTAGCWC